MTEPVEHTVGRNRLIANIAAGLVLLLAMLLLIRDVYITRFRTALIYAELQTLVTKALGEHEVTQQRQAEILEKLRRMEQRQIHIREINDRMAERYLAPPAPKKEGEDP
jgi:hypothetical protein